MQLDNTRIAIRERSYVDLLDLALRMSREHAWPLLLTLSAGIAPMMLLNSWLLAGYARFDSQLGFPVEYMFYMVLLVILEAPLATAAATLYLGEAVFSRRPDPRTIVDKLRESLSQLLFYQGLFRIWYLRWCYLNEVILLERNRMRRKAPQEKSTRQRAREVHRGEAGDVVTRSFRAAGVGGVLLASFWYSTFLVRKVLLSEWEWDFDRPMYTFYFQLALWLVVGYFTVVRFLSYLDLRIRREGWEVELVMRAEGARLGKRGD